MPDPLRIFFSYSHEDAGLHARLWKHLSIYEKTGKIERWDDRIIKGGEDWDKEIKEKLESADLIILELSASFNDSKYCWGIEMTRAMERHNAGQAQVIPVYLKPCVTEGAPYAHLHRIPAGLAAIDEWSNQDTALKQVAEDFGRIVNEWRSNKSPSLAPPAPHTQHWEREFHRIDFDNVRKTCDKHLSPARKECTAVLFAIQHFHTRGGRWCLQHLYEHMDNPASWVVEISPLEDPIATVLSRLSAHCGSKPDAASIIDRICGAVCQSSHAALIEIHLMEPQAAFFQWFTESFWAPLAARMPAISENYHFVRFAAAICLEDPSPVPGTLPLKLRNWTKEEIWIWLDKIARIPNATTATTAKLAESIYSSSSKGQPNTVRELIQKELLKLAPRTL
ncbi:MAG: toll/interleukin-1 receptor domain-containing protein [Bryobacteraceae bacterium]|nr:toll/interleukin-1 receptor domain-containing protein [Bryobacteraceae bacterium]